MATICKLYRPIKLIQHDAGLRTLFVKCSLILSTCKCIHVNTFRMS